MPGKKIEISDDCLMKQLKLKSYRAFEVVFNRYYAGLYRFALAYLKMWFRKCFVRSGLLRFQFPKVPI